MPRSRPPLAAGLLLAFGFAVVQTTAQGPREIERIVEQAHIADTTAGLAAQWTRRLDRDSNDHVAALGLAALAHVERDFEAARRRYAALTGGRGGLAGEVALQARLGLARILQTAADFRAADSAFTIVIAGAAAAHDTATWLEGLVGLASARARTVGAVSATAVLDDAERLAGAAGLRGEAAYRCVRAGTLILSTPDESAAQARRGAELARSAPHPRMAGVCQAVLAQYFMRRGMTDSVEHHADRAITALALARDEFTLSALHQWRGWYRTNTGYYGGARRDLSDAIREADASGNRSTAAWAALNLALLSVRFADWDGVVRAARRAEAMFAQQGDVSGAARASLVLASAALETGDLTTARQLYDSATVAGARPGMSDLATTGLIGMASVALALGDYAAAVAALDSARVVFRAGRQLGWEQGLEMTYAEVALRRGDLDAAARYLDPMVRITLQPTRRHGARTALAEVHARRGDIARAESTLVDASEQLEHWLAGLDDDALRLHAFGLREVHRGVATVIAALGQAGRVETAFDQAERRRARELLRRMMQAREITRGQAGGTGGLARPRAVVTLADLSAALDYRSALLEYVTGRGGEPTTLLVVTRDSARAYVLAPIDSVLDRVERFATLVESGADPRSLGAELGAALLGPAVADLSSTVTRLLIVADDALHRVPFDALVLADGRVVLERFAVAFTPSATMAVDVWRRKRTTRTPRMLVLADPAVDGGEVASVDAADYTAAFAKNGGLPRLAGAAREGRHVGRFAAGADVRLRGDASETFLKRASLPDYAVLYFATHALVDDAAVTRTALALSPGEGDDGFVGPAELAGLTLDADLVVLSACRTAGGVLVRGEGLQGLTAPLLQAGARAVVATAWRIRDRGTIDLMDGFFASLAAGLPAADALREAKLAARARGAPPSEWAAFTIVGDPLVTVALTRPTSRWPRWAIGAIAVALLIFALGWWRRSHAEARARPAI